MVRAEALRLWLGPAYLLAGLGGDLRLCRDRDRRRRSVQGPASDAGRNHDSCDVPALPRRSPHHARRLALALGRGRGMMLITSLMTAAALASIPLSALGPNGPLAGTYLDAGRSAPVVLIIPG